MTKKIIEIMVSIIGIGIAIYLSYLHGTVYQNNQGLMACACFIGFCSAYFFIINICKMLKENNMKKLKK